MSATDRTSDNPLPPPSGHPLNASAVLSAYRAMAPVYNWVFGPSFERGRRQVIRALDCQPGDRVLEVGVGTGLSLRHWNPACHVTGIDLSPHMLARAEKQRQRRRLAHVELLEMDAQATTFPDHSFDRIAAMYVVSVVPDLGALLREMKRVCRPGGRIAIVNHFEQRNGLVRAFERSLASYAGLLGFHTAMPLSRVTDFPGFRILRAEPANLAGYWTLIVAENLP